MKKMQGYASRQPFLLNYETIIQINKKRISKFIITVLKSDLSKLTDDKNKKVTVNFGEKCFKTILLYSSIHLQKEFIYPDDF